MFVKVFVKHGHETSGKWFSPRIVSQVDNFSSTVCVPGSNFHKIIAALEDTRVGITDDDLASHIFESIEKIDDSIDYALRMDEIHSNDHSFE